jgi:hypothetical protein
VDLNIFLLQAYFHLKHDPTSWSKYCTVDITCTYNPNQISEKHATSVHYTATEQYTLSFSFSFKYFSEQHIDYSAHILLMNMPIIIPHLLQIKHKNIKQNTKPFSVQFLFPITISTLNRIHLFQVILCW